MNHNATASETVTREMQAGMHQLQAAIAAHPFAHGLSREHLAMLSDCAMETRFEPGELIFREGEFANRLYFLIEGEVALESGANGRATTIGVLGAGEVLGWSWLFPPYCWHFTARAVKPTRAIFFYGTWLREHCEQNHDLGYELVKRMAEIVIHRLQTTRTQLAVARSTTTKDTDHENS